MPVITYDPYQGRNYVAPTVFKKNGITPAAMPAYPYFDSFTKGLAQYNALKNKTTKPTAAGYITITKPGAETLAVNVDFYIPLFGKWIPAAYSTIKGIYSYTPYILAKGFTAFNPDPVYFVIDTEKIGISATTVWAQGENQAKELDLFQREVQLLKFRYNSLAVFLNELSKKQLSAKEQQIYNEGIFKLTNLNNQIRTVSGIEVVYNENGTIGAIPILLIAIIAISAAATAWSITKIISEREKTRRINESYDLSRWLSEKQQQIANDPNISAENKRQILETMNQAQKTANKVAERSVNETKGLFGNLANIVQWGVIGLILFKGLQIIENKNAIK